MGTIKPFMTYITVQDVEHEDAMIDADLDIPSSLVNMLGLKTEDLKQPQGIAAGVIINVGKTVEDLSLKPGYKVYYQAGFARKINDVWLVDARAVMAYEEI